MYHTFRLFERSRKSGFLETKSSVITINMALIQTIQMKNFCVEIDSDLETMTLLEVSFNNKTIIVEPQNYDEFQLMMDQMSQR